MNQYQQLQSARILSCYLEKGGVGSGRHKNSIPELEESNFSPDVEEKHRAEAEDIMNEPVKEAERQVKEKEKKKKKLELELKKLVDLRDETRVNLKGLLALRDSKLAKFGAGSQEYKKIQKVCDEKRLERIEIIKMVEQKEKELNDFNR